MAHLVLAAATSHSPLLALPPETWVERARDDESAKGLRTPDGQTVSYGDLLAQRGRPYAEHAQLEAWRSASAACARALAELRKSIAEAKPDVVVIVGDDQGELFTRANAPMIAVFTGESVLTSDALGRPEVPAWLKTVGAAYGMDAVHAYPGAPKIAGEIVQGLVDRCVDVSVVADVPHPQEAGVGHAFGFISERVLPDHGLPIVPIFLNTFHPPNVPTPARAVAMGAALGEAIGHAGSAARVALIASGGLSHFVVDEALDRRVLDMIGDADLEGLAALSPQALVSGTSEILNWVVVAAAAERAGLQPAKSKYVPVYRTAAGTGCGMGFAFWRPRD